MGQISWTISLVMIGLFAFAIVGFAMGFASDNDSPISIYNDAELTNLYSDANESIRDFRTQSEQSYASIMNSTIGPGDETTESGGQFKITPVSAISGVKNVFEVGYNKIFGGSSSFAVFMTAFFSLLVFITGLYIWKAWAGKNPD